MRLRAYSAVLFGLALLVQVFAPVSATMALARASDSILRLVICAEGAGQADDQGHSVPVSGQHDHCLLCQAGTLAGVALPPAMSGVVAYEGAVSQLTWAPYTARAPPVLIGHHAPPRGPPSLA